MTNRIVKAWVKFEDGSEKRFEFTNIAEYDKLHQTWKEHGFVWKKKLYGICDEVEICVPYHQVKKITVSC